MFRVSEITNAHRRGADKQRRKMQLTNNALFKRWPCENKPMPYFSIVPEQVEREERYRSLTGNAQGQFLRLCLWLQGMGRRGMCAYFLPEIITALQIDAGEVKGLLFEFIQAGLLVKSEDGHYIIQPELREQCLHYLALPNELIEMNAIAAGEVVCFPFPI